MAETDTLLQRRLKLRDLTLLQEVARHGSMAKAARHLGITQPAVTKAISELEAMTGVRLFDRRAGEVTLTLYGEALLRRADVIIDELRQASADITHLSDPGSGELRIACPEFLAAGILPVTLQRFAKRFPNVVVDVVQAENISPEYRLLRERRVDLTICRVSPPFDAPDVTTEVLFSERLLVVTGGRSKWVKKRKLTLAELAMGSWILSPAESLPGVATREAFAAEKLDLPQARIVSFSIHLRTAVAAYGDFLTILPGSVLQLSPKRFGLRVLPVELRLKSQPVAVVTLRDRTIAPAAESFLACLREVARSLERR